jgi:hypothetical protein
MFSDLPDDFLPSRYLPHSYVPTTVKPERPPLNMEAWMWWETPCTKYDVVPNEDFSDEFDFPVMNNLNTSKLFNFLKITTHNALATMDDFKNMYLAESFDFTAQEFVSWSKATSLSKVWRPKFRQNKELLVPFDKGDFLHDYYFDDYMADSLRYCQMVAAALEQVRSNLLTILCSKYLGGLRGSFAGFLHPYL